ncbi:MAG: Rho termination factor N-terminal domain-containing protein, partial [Acidimicrobiales bacterium]
MSGGPELERSLLERKERDELHVIAEALGVRPGSKTKKADLIDQILRAAGVETGPAEGSVNGSAAPGPPAPPTASGEQGSDGDATPWGAGPAPARPPAPAAEPTA